MSQPSNLEEWLIARGDPHTGIYKCPLPGCTYRGAASTFANVGERRDQFGGNKFVCAPHFHKINAEIEARLLQIELDYIASLPEDEQAKISALVDWWSPESEEANHIRAERRILFGRWSWVLQEGQGDHLTNACKDAFRAYFNLLNRLAVDFEKPSKVEWPPIPALAYKE